MTIHMIGQKPNTAPSSAASPACPIGIEYTVIAIRIDTPSAIKEAHWAFILKPPSRTNSTTSGKTAKTAVSPREWETGSRTCLYTVTSLCLPDAPGRVAFGSHLPKGASRYAIGCSPRASTSAVWSARRRVPALICVRHEKPSAISNVSSSAARTAGRRNCSPIRIETSYCSPAP